MFNLFKSPTKQQVITNNNNIIPDESSLLVKQFQNLNISIYGTYEEPLFKAKDIGDLLGIEQIRKTIRHLDNEDKILQPGNSITGLKEQYYLTENGLYELLFISRKPIAKIFKTWIKNVIKEIRLKGKYDLEEQLKLKDIETRNLLREKEQELHQKELELSKYKKKKYEEIQKTGHIYVIQTDGGIKVGKTKDAVHKRIKGLQTGNNNDIQILLDFSTSNADLLEKIIHYVLDRYRCNSNREFFDCNINYIKTVVNIIGITVDTLKSTYQNISKEELLEKLGDKLEIEFLFESTNEHNLPSYDENDNINENVQKNTFYTWLDENIIEKVNGILNLKDVCELYFQKDISIREKNKIKKEIEKYISEKYPHISSTCKESRFNNSKYYGWKGIAINDE